MPPNKLTGTSLSSLKLFLYFRWKHGYSHPYFIVIILQYEQYLFWFQFFFSQFHLTFSCILIPKSLEIQSLIFMFSVAVSQAFAISTRLFATLNSSPLQSGIFKVSNHSLLNPAVRYSWSLLPQCPQQILATIFLQDAWFQLKFSVAFLQVVN